VRFGGGGTVADVNGCAGKVAYRGYRRAERLADLPFEDVELKVVVEAELES
jgi:hypothetical protein